MTLQLYNTATRRKETFTPRETGKVGLYVCGVTVYDLCHIGHARSAIVFDVLVRYLRAKGLEVTYVRNFTDVDDKIIDRAAQIGEEPAILAQRFIDAFYEDMGLLGVLKADIEPRATEHVDGMIAMIEALLQKGLAYAVDGDVFYSVEAFRGYGALSGRKLEDMKAGSRIAVDEKKRHPMDFALWKSAKPGEPQWSSPWGPGRPGWHLECSVMSNRYLGASFDIHGGGRDLLFPHHENERAQSIGANGGEFARFWVHNGFVTVEGEKMSKSLGNFLTIRDAVGLYHPQVLRLFLLSKHYRSPLDFSKGAVLGQQSGLVRIYRTLKRLEEEVGHPASLPDFKVLAEGQNDDTTFVGAFVRAMEDDLNTAGAIGILFEKVRDLNRILDADPAENRFEELQTARGELLAAASVLGLLETPPDVFFEEMTGREPTVDRAEVDALVEERMQARTAKDWAKADRIRDQLKEMGVVLEDGPGGTTWRLDV